MTHSRTRASGRVIGRPCPRVTKPGPPGPTPRIVRPPLAWSSVAIAMAISAGVRVYTLMMAVPSRMRRVAAITVPSIAKTSLAELSVGRNAS